MASPVIRLTPTVYFYRAVSYFENYDYTNAARNFSLALQSSDLFEPFKSEAYNYLGFIKFELNSFSDAVIYFNQALSSGSLDQAQKAMARYHRGMANNKLGSYQTVVSDLTSAIGSGVLGPYELGLAYLVIGMLRSDNQQFTQALSDLTMAINNEELSRELKGEARIRRAKAKVAMGLYRDAIEDISFIIHSELPDKFFHAAAEILRAFPQQIIMDCLKAGTDSFNSGDYLQAESYLTPTLFYPDISENFRAVALMIRTHARIKLGKFDQISVEITEFININLLSLEVKETFEKFKVELMSRVAASAAQDLAPSCRPG